MIVAAHLLVLLAPLQAQPRAAAPGDVFSMYSAGVPRVVADKRDKGLVSLLSDLDHYVELIERQSGEPAPAAVHLATRWLLQPACVNVGVGMGAPTVQVDVRWDDRKQALEELAHLRDALGEGGIRLVASAEAAGSMHADTPGGRLTAQVRSDGQHAVLTLALGREAGPAFRTPDVSMPTGVEPVFSARFDGRALAPVMEMVANGQGDEGRTARDVLAELGLVGPDVSPISFAMGHGAKESISTVHFPGWKSTFLGERMSTLLQPAHLRMLPADTLWSWIGNAPPSALLELVRRFDQGGEFEKGLAMANAATGVNLERDVIGRIGPMVGAFASRGTGGGSGPMGLVAFAQCDDPSRVMATLERLVARFAKDNGAKVETKKWKHGDDVCLSFLMPGTPLPLEPTFATTGDVLYVAVSRSAIKEALDQRALRERRTSILDHPRLKELPTGALQGLIAFGFNDTPEALERGYGTLTMLQSSLGSMIQGAGLPAGAQAFVPDLSELLPTFTAMARGARPSLSLTYVHGEDLLAATTHDSSFLARMTATLGSPGGQIQPMMVPMVAAVAIPRLMASRLKANEAAAISTLRSIASAQAQLQHSGAIDVDVDGGGEYGLFGDLAGSRNLRGTDAPLAPAVLSPAFGELQPDDCGGAVIRRSGYIFQMWLPGKWVPGATTGVTDSPVAGPAEGVDADASEVLWRCYAWPEKAGQTGQRAFFLDQEGDLYFLANTPDVTRRPYEGTCADGGRQPTFDAISETAGDFDSHPPATGGLSSDGELWQRLL